jgi:monoamine oxidase
MLVEIPVPDKPSELRTITRRTLLKTSLALAAALRFALDANSRALTVSPAKRSQRVIVVGAGIAGLVAAFELMRSGHDVRVFEARARPGGRIYTLRQEFSDGLYVEGGAYDFGDAYTVLRQYISLFGLTLDDGPTAKDDRASVYYIEGKRYVIPPGHAPDWPYSLTAEERKLGPYGLWDKFASPLAKGMRYPLTPGWPDDVALQLDGSTIDDLLRKQAASDGVRALMQFVFHSEDFDHVSALQELGWQKFFDSNKQWSRLRGGNDQLPAAFAKRLLGRIHYGAELRSVSQDAQRVRLSIFNNGVLQNVEADRVVLAIPFSVLRHVQMDSSISQQKRATIAGVRYDSATRVYLQSKSRFWLKEHLKGFVATDLPIGYILDFTEGQAGTRGILATECLGSHARKAISLSPAQRLRWGLENVSKVFPEMTTEFEHGKAICWDEEPWSLGAFAYYGPGEMTTMFPHAASQEGRMHFAGEHTAAIYVMEGAAQSGARCVQEINSAA